MKNCIITDNFKPIEFGKVGNFMTSIIALRENDWNV
jgi:hypothetical protein